MTVCECVASRIKVLLKEKSMTLYRLEKNSGVQHGVLRKIMKCCNKSVNMATVVLIAKGFNMSLVEFLNDPLFSMDNIEAE